MYCCGRERGGRFCPECGQPLQEQSLLGLLAHIRSTIMSLETILENRRATAGEPGPHRRAAFLSASIERKERTLAKWRGWEAEIVRLAGLPGEKRD